MIISLKILGIMIILLGIAYPFFITGIAQIAFHDKANGSLIEKEGKVVGSCLIGQQFDSSTYFSSRPSVCGYNTLPSAASNLSLTSKKLDQQITERKEHFMQLNKIISADSIPSEMLFASGSGLDPHISPQAAWIQINRIAESRGFSEIQKQKLQSIILENIEKPQWGFMGEPRVNVLLLNLQLDDIK